MKYFKNTSWLFAEKILRMIVGLFVGIWVARYLGPEQYGLFSYAQSFVGLFIVFSTLGIDSIVVRELVKDENKRDKLLGTAFWLKLIGAFGVLSILVVAVHFTSNDTYTNTLIFIIASATIFQSFNVIDMYFQSRVLSKYIVYANVISLFISSIIKIILILNEAPLIAFVWVALFNTVVLVCGFIYFYLYNHLSLRAWEYDKQIAKALFKHGWPLMLSAVVVSIYMKIDQVMIKEMLGSEAVGQYAVAVRLSEAWYFVPVAISSSLFPAIINAKKQSKEAYYDKLQKLYDLMVWIAIAIAIPMTFLSTWIVDFLYGNSFNQAGSVLMIHIWSGVFVFLTVSSGKFLIAENMVMKTFYRNTIAMIVNIVLNIYAIKEYGIDGAAIATLVSWIISGYIYDLFDKDVRFMFIQKTKSLIAYPLIKKYMLKR